MITIVISSYKYGHLAAHCIESVLSQTIKPEKILFVDDGVGDCSHLVDLYPEVEFILREENMGTVDNFQDMLMRVDTEYVMFLGADNWLRDDTIQLLTEEIKSDPTIDILTYDIHVTGELKDKWVGGWSRNVRVKDMGGWYLNMSSSHHGSMLYRTKLGQSVGYTRGSGKNTEEDKQIYNGMLKKRANKKHLSQSLLYYRRHKENFIKI